jgi:hypothetical protein
MQAASAAGLVVITTQELRAAQMAALRFLELSRLAGRREIPERLVRPLQFRLVFQALGGLVEVRVGLVGLGALVPVVVVVVLLQMVTSQVLVPQAVLASSMSWSISDARRSHQHENRPCRKCHHV